MAESAARNTRAYAVRYRRWSDSPPCYGRAQRIGMTAPHIVRPQPGRIGDQAAEIANTRKLPIRTRPGFDACRATITGARSEQRRRSVDSSANTRESSLGVYSVMRRLQLWSGVVLLTYLLMHLANHALGIWSLELAGRGLEVALRLWRSTPGTIALYGAAFAHFSLALRTIYGRCRWALPAAEWIRLWAGLSLPLLLIRHAVTTRLASALYGFEPNYERVVVMLLTSGTGPATCTARPRLDTRMPRAVVPVAPLCAGVAHEARAACIRSPVAAVNRGRFCPDDARRHGEEFVAPRFRSEAACSSTGPERVASRFRRRLSDPDRWRVRRKPIAQPARTSKAVDLSLNSRPAPDSGSVPSRCEIRLAHRPGGAARLMPRRANQMGAGHIDLLPCMRRAKRARSGRSISSRN